MTSNYVIFGLAVSLMFNVIQYRYHKVTCYELVDRLTSLLAPFKLESSEELNDEEHD